MKALFAVLLVLAVLSAAITQIAADNWAILVAGSDQYYNYRHQSDVCHSFQILKKNGIPESNIIVMMKDDIANNAQNPKKGQIFNYIGGPDVYKGVPKDYTGSDVNPQNFLKVLRGENMGSKKTLKAGPNDNVFVFFSDHGAEGLIAFPSAYLYAKDLMTTIKYMKDNQKYGKLLFYIEACESGSMFANLLPKDWNVYGHTASNPHVSSWACDMDKSVNAYLNDCWSRNWMNDTELHSNSLNSYSVGEQFKNVKSMTTQSPACRYGDVSLEKETIGAFQGVGSQRSMFGLARPMAASGSKISSREVKTAYLRHMAESTNAPEWQRQLEEHLTMRSTLDMVWNTFAQRLAVKVEPQPMKADDQCGGITLDHDCIKEATEAAVAACGKVMYAEENMEYLKYISRACSAGIHPTLQTAVLNEVCSVVRL